MSETTELGKGKVKYMVFDKRESIAQAFVCNLGLFGMLALLIYISRGSNWWTLVTGCIFLLVLCARVAAVFKTRTNVFYTKADLIKWAEKIEE